VKAEVVSSLKGNLDISQRMGDASFCVTQWAEGGLDPHGVKSRT
jgi:hypothetical protein